MRLKILPQALILAFAGLVALPSCNAQQPASPAPKAQAAAQAKPGEKVIARVNGVAIPESHLDLIMNERLAQGQPDTPELRVNVREDLINREILAQEAVKGGLDKKPDVAAQLEIARESLLARAYLQDYLKAHPPSDEALKQEYDKIKAQLGDKEYKARHILVGTEAEAKTLIAQLKKGAKFEKLAQEKSKDAGSKVQGGELGWNAPAAFVKPFADALVKLKKGQITETPVQSPFGWHVIKLEDVRPLKAPAFDEIKDSLRQRMQQEQLAALVKDLRAKAKVE